MDGEFMVWVFYEDGSSARDTEWVDAATAVDRARRITDSIGARLGVVRCVIITDAGDDTNFEWTHGKGVTFPPLGDSLTAGSRVHRKFPFNPSCL
jgi:hypothetical protein